jgi:hypothetical protein
VATPAATLERVVPALHFHPYPRTQRYLIRLKTAMTADQPPSSVKAISFPTKPFSPSNLHSALKLTTAIQTSRFQLVWTAGRIGVAFRPDFYKTTNPYCDVISINGTPVLNALTLPMISPVSREAFDKLGAQLHKLMASSFVMRVKDGDSVKDVKITGPKRKGPAKN